MVYEWKIPGIFSTQAQAAGEELNRIYQTRGKLDPADVVDESRPEAAPLHPCFEWDDQAAAEKYREHQARKIMCCIITRVETPEKQTVEVRAIHHAAGTYRPYEVVISHKDMKQEMMADALKSMDAFKRKFDTLSCVSNVITAINAASQEIKKELEK